MRNTQTVKEFILKWESSVLPCKEILYDYKNICANLLFEDEDLVREVTDLLRTNISLWAKYNSPVYSSETGLLSKQKLQNKENWYVESIRSESMHMATNGSTTGNAFQYLRWDPFLYFIECENHYDLIMDEFKIRENPEILFFFNSNRYEKDKIVTVRNDSDNFTEHHGIKRKANVHYVNFEMYQNERDIFIKKLVLYLLKNKMDVILAPGPATHAVCEYLKKNIPVVKELCVLLSNTNERLLPYDASYLMSGYAKNICDHMRCWDGGATFFTCKNKRYHLMDNLSWCEEVDEMLVSTDYFSLPSPFVYYWNGDFCKIGNRYNRCDCGRLYREFTFLENRPFSLKGKSMSDIKSTISSLRINNIKEIRCSVEFVEIVSSSPLDITHQSHIRNKFPVFNFKFLVEK